MYAILGASGEVGSAALAALAALATLAPSTRHAPQGGPAIRALSRRRPEALPAGAEWIGVDARDTDALARALDAVTVAFVLNPVPDDAADVFAAAEQWTTSIAKAVVGAGVRRLVALSSQGAERAEGSGVIVALHRFEHALAATGIPTSVVRPAYFMESWLPVIAPAVETGELPAFRHPVEVPFDTISAGDVGRLVAGLMVAPRPPAILQATGPRRYSEDDAAGLLARLAGRPVRAVAVPVEARAPALIDTGLSPSYANALAAMYEALDTDGLPFAADLPTHRGSTSLEAVLAAGLARHRAPAT